MAVTEKQAAGMWCPQARFTAGTGEFQGSGGWNRRMVDEDHDRCLGSRCMAWRWSNNHRIVGFCGAFGDPRASLPTVVMEDEP